MKKIIIAISGASGAIYGITSLKLLKKHNIETHLIVSDAAKITLHEECALSINDVKELATHCYNINDIGAKPASGTFDADGMIIAPCSIKTMSEIANCISGNLITRSADVMLKERKKLVVALRETPFHAGHLHNMLKITEAGGIIAPPVPAFYTKPQNIEDIVTQSCCRLLSLLDIKCDNTIKWKE